MFNLSPKNDKFFDMFISFSQYINEAALLFKKFAEDPSEPDKKFQQIKDVEHNGDEKLHEIFEELNNSFITPIDREDIYHIGKSMDDILDFIEITASRYVMFNITSSRPQAIATAELVIQIAGEVMSLMTELKKMNKSKKISSIIVEINRLENQGDVMFRNAVRELFDGMTPVMDVIVWKEVYERLERVIDACEDVANIVEGVVMKHA